MDFELGGIFKMDGIGPQSRVIIDGKLYDVNTATQIETVTVHEEYDSYVYDLTLYRKSNGEFFLHRDNFIGYGDVEFEMHWMLMHQFTPLTDDEARKWVETYSSVETYESIFGLPEE